MNVATPIVRAMAVNRTFHHGRPSSTSYALFSVSMIATIAADELETASSTPSVNNPVSSSPEILIICSVMSCNASGGMNPAIVRNRSSISVVNGKQGSYMRRSASIGCTPSARRAGR